MTKRNKINEEVLSILLYSIQGWGFTGRFTVETVSGQRVPLSFDTPGRKYAITVEGKKVNSAAEFFKAIEDFPTVWADASMPLASSYESDGSANFYSKEA